MDSIRCPMCGKPNPPETVICQFCQARLEPLIAPPPAEDKEPNQPEDALDEKSSLPSWLDGLRDNDEAVQGDELDTGESQEETEWSVQGEDRLSSAFSTSIEPDAEQEQDWLSRLMGDESRQEGDAESTTGAGSAPSAFLSMDELLGEEDSSDWLAEFQTSSLGLEGPIESSAAASKDEEISQEELPSWLESIRSKQEKEVEEEKDHLPPAEISPQEPGAGSPGPTDDVDGEPDWLSDIGIEEGGDNFTIDSKDLPDWMLEAKPQQAEEEPGGGSKIPGWLTESEMAGEELVQQEGQELPDWLAEGEKIETSAARAPEKELPDWLSNIGKSGLPEPVESETEETPAGSEESDLPDWLTRLDTSGTYQPSSADSPALILDDDEQVEEIESARAEGAAEEGDYSAIPDWLSQISSLEEQAEESAPLEDELEPDLAAAQLPSWLQAMRPVESAAPSTPTGHEEAGAVEQVGPLAGLSGVLAAEPEFIHIRKPQSSLVKLQVSDNQQSHITLLENLLAEEGQAKPVTGRPTITSQYFLRLLIALAVLVSVILPLWLNRQILTMPDPAGVSNEVYDFGRQIGGLPPGAPVLVAFDYEPGFAGEIDTSAVPVLEEIVSRGTHLAMVSTNPTGPLLAERFTIQRLPDLQTSLTNLGYVPGGAGGLLAFAQSPRAVVPFDLHGARVWEAGPLSAVNSISDFGAVIVLTENPDTARAWIEQAQPLLGLANKPLLMVLSAQAEPMVRPYYETSPRQVSGMISGLAGGAAFESLSGKSGLARLYWDAFGTGLVIAVGLILIGGLVSLVMALLAQPQKKEVEGAL
jgi:hypothetical protein